MVDPSLVVCPVCETRQANAWYCAICGKALHALPRHPQVATSALEDLEITDLDPTRTNVAVEILAGLEPTFHAPVHPGSTPEPAPRSPEEKRSCPGCGARDQLPGDRCRQCGRFVPAEE